MTKKSKTSDKVTPKVKKQAKPKTKKQTELDKLKTQVKSLDAQIKEVSTALEHSKDKNVRLLAEFDNYKRRTQDEKHNLFRYSGEKIIKDILPVLDDLHRTVEVESSEKNSVIDGIRLIINKLDKVLEENAITPFHSVNEIFDPEIHEALMSEDSDKDEGVILKEFEKGYKYHEKIIRHAKVVVSK